MVYYNQEMKKGANTMMVRFSVTFWNGETNKVRLFKTLEEAKNFIRVCRQLRPEYSDFKIKVIKF